MFKIEKNIPMEAKSKYPFAQMGISDSFFVPSKEKLTNTASKVRSSAFRYGKVNGLKFVTRIVVGGVRVWRTA